MHLTRKKSTKLFSVVTLDQATAGGDHPTFSDAPAFNACPEADF